MSMLPKDSNRLILFVEHCTSPRPSATLKGDSERYSDLSSKLEYLMRDKFETLFEGRIDFRPNPPPRDTPYNFMDPVKAARRLRGFSDKVKQELLDGVQVLESTSYPPRVHYYPRIGSFEVCPSSNATPCLAAHCLTC